MIDGCDVSHHQGQVNWDAVRRDFKFVVIRATYGTVLVDRQFKRNQGEARRVGLTRGYYHYCLPEGNDVDAEVNYFLNAVGDIQPGEFLVLDFEEKYPDAVNWCLQWMRKVEQRVGFKPMIYLNQYLTNAHNWAPVVAENFGLWVAKYDSKKDKVPVGHWPFAAMKQYTSSGSGGDMSPLDLNVFYGDEDTLRRYGKPGHSQPTQPEPPTNEITVEEIFKNIFIAFFERWPTQDEVNEFKSSGDPLPYHYFQVKYLNPAHDDFKKQIAEAKAQAAHFEKLSENNMQEIVKLNADVVSLRAEVDSLTSQLTECLLTPDPAPKPTLEDLIWAIINLFKKN